MKEKKIRRTASVLESVEKRLLEAYSESERTCNVAVFAGDMIVLGLQVQKILNRERKGIIASLGGGVKQQVIQFPGRA
jgi:hypothetical protein